MSWMARFAGLVVMTALLGGLSTSLLRAEETPEAYTAEVTASEAKFIFPLPDRPVWSWNQPATPIDLCEYEWAADVATQEHTYEFGFFLFKASGSTPARGDIRALLEAGQMSLAIMKPSGFSLVPDAPVDVEAVGSRLVVAVTHPDILRMLFSGRPPRAVFNVVLPGEKPSKHEVLITYE